MTTTKMPKKATKKVAKKVTKTSVKKSIKKVEIVAEAPKRELSKSAPKDLLRPERIDASLAEFKPQLNVPREISNKLNPAYRVTTEKDFERRVKLMTREDLFQLATTVGVNRDPERNKMENILMTKFKLDLSRCKSDIPPVHQSFSREMQNRITAKYAPKF